MKILLISFTDSSNLGDQLIVECLKKDLSKIGEVSTLSYNLTIQTEHTLLNHKTKTSSKFRDFYFKYLRQKTLFDKLHGLLNKRYVKKLNWNNLEESLTDIDFVVLGGGNAIFALTPNTATTYKVSKIVDYIQNKSIPTILLSAGIGPFKNRKQETDAKLLLSKFQGITVRDRSSYEYVSDLENAYISIDPVFFLTNKRDTSQLNNRVAICVMDIRANKATENEYQLYLKSMQKMIVEILQKYPNEDIILFSSEPKDYNAVNDLYTSLNHHKKVKKEEVNKISDLLSFYESIDFLYGTRMHSMIVAHTQLIPVAGISWQPKVKEFFNIIGQQHRVFDLENFDTSISELVNIYGEVSQNRQGELESIKRSIIDLLDIYGINNTVISRVLEGTNNGQI
ncbi:polysaccharide pyruvyl transferase family protein [Streptococcus pluranimalium]